MNLPQRTFGEIANLRNGVNYVVADQGEVVRVVGVGDFQGRSELSSFESLSEIRLRSNLSPDDELQDGDLLFVRSNGNKSLIGRCMVIKNPPAGVTFSGFTIRARIDKSEALPEYISLVFQGGSLNRQMTLAGGGNGNISNLNQTLLATMPVDLPSLEFQKVLVTCVSTWDTAIQKTEQLIAAKERVLAALRQRLFVRKVRKGFARVKLDTILTERQELSDGQSPVYSVSVRKGLVNQIEHLGRSFSAATTDHYSMVRPGDVVYTKSPTGDFPLGIVKQSRANESSIVSPLYGVFVPRRREIGVLVDFFFASPINASNYLRPLVQKGAKNTLSISNDEFLRGEITLPTDSDLVDRIATFIDQARQELDLLEFRVQLLKKQKRGLMQKLLTGQWRLPVHAEAS